MDLKRIYEEFIADRLTKQKGLRRYERHHVVPKCLGGGNGSSNIIRLLPEEHLFAHILLAKIHGGLLAVSVVRMLGMKKYSGRRSRLKYATLRAQHAETMSKKLKGRKMPEGFGAKISAILSDPLVRANIPLTESNRRFGDLWRGKPKSLSQREKMKASWNIPEVRAARTAHLANQNPSAETRAKRSAALKGRPLAPETCQKMRKPKSEEGRRNIRAARIERAARERAAKEASNAV